MPRNTRAQIGLRRNEKTPEVDRWWPLVSLCVPRQVTKNVTALPQWQIAASLRWSVETPLALISLQKQANPMPWDNVARYTIFQPSALGWYEWPPQLYPVTQEEGGFNLYIHVDVSYLLHFFPFRPRHSNEVFTLNAHSICIWSVCTELDRCFD